ncbi:hypothetical protein [Streptomyces sp. NPDC059894]|uniref:hypothetical protein n=1 Tax=unclassified Streptomyces TaxID=2593676 RepID=UPI003664839B
MNARLHCTGTGTGTGTGAGVRRSGSKLYVDNFGADTASSTIQPPILDETVQSGCA